MPAFGVRSQKENIHRIFRIRQKGENKMNIAHIRGILAALLFAASTVVLADDLAKVSPLDGLPRGATESVTYARGSFEGFVKAVDAPQPVHFDSAVHGKPAPFLEMYPRLASIPKTVASGLYMSGRFTGAWLGSTVTLTLDGIQNESFSRTTGTLRLELWAVSSPPARAGGWTGYKLATFSTLSPLPPRTFYSDIVRTGTMSYPPDGTYWLVLALTEYSPGSCSQADGYCLQDSLNSDTTSTFGNAAPPPPPPPPTRGVATRSLGARATVSGSATAFGGFSVATSARVYILVRGNSLGSLGVTQAYMDAPRVRLYNAAGSDLVSQAGMAGFNFCVSSNTTTDLPVVQLYQGRGQPVHPRDSCYTTVLGAGSYTFSVTPSNGATSASTSSTTFSGEVLFEVTLTRP